MGDRGFFSGFIGVSIDVAVRRIFHHVPIALRCNKELNCLRDLVMRIEPVISQIQQYRLALNKKRGIPISQSDIAIKASAVNEWLKKLDSLLRKASAMAQECTIPSCDLISSYRTSRRITRLITDIKQHLDSVRLMGWASVLEGLGHINKQSVEAMAAASSASTSATTSEPVPSTGTIINEPLIVGQGNALERLEKLVTDAEVHSLGVVGMGGSGKTLLLKTLFNSEKVRNLFCDGLMLWVTVYEAPFLSLRKELSAQIGMQTKVDPHTIMNRPLIDSIQGKRFALFLDDVWEKGAELLEYLGLLWLIYFSNSKIIVSSRNYRALLEMGVAKDSTITMEDLIEDDSWRLFSFYAFPYNNGNVPAGIDQGTAKAVCEKCGGLPLALKAVGGAMAGITDAQECGFAVQRLPKANSKDDQAVYARLRFSYDALGNYDVHLQLGFLYLAAAFLEDEVVQVDSQATLLWMGEGLLGKKKLEDEAVHDPIEMGRVYANVLADRCLIEPTLRDVDGRVVSFRLHDVLRGLAIQIAEEEENFYCRAGKGLTGLNINEFSPNYARIVLTANNLSSLSESLRAPEISSLLLARNINFEKFPKRVIGSMISLRVLDLSWTSLTSLPNSVGCLKQLELLNLVGVPIQRLPPSFTKLESLQILRLDRSRIRELPWDIHKLRSLRHLSLIGCNDLQCLPRSISGLTSLWSLYIDCPKVWTKKDLKRRGEEMACINDIRSLTQLKDLRVENHREIINEGTLGGMVQMETLQLKLNMTGLSDDLFPRLKFQIPCLHDSECFPLPDDIIDMSKLKRLSLECSYIVKMESKLCRFQNLSRLKLSYCTVLQELPHLHNLRNLRQIDIIRCPRLKRFSKEFGEIGAFPLLEKCSMVQLNELEELPMVKEGAMPTNIHYDVV